jgi:hypothetical protein
MGVLFCGSILLIMEARLALAALHAEMDFLWKLGQRHAPVRLNTPRRRLTFGAWRSKQADVSNREERSREPFGS